MSCGCLRRDPSTLALVGAGIAAKRLKSVKIAIEVSIIPSLACFCLAYQMLLSGIPNLSAHLLQSFPVAAWLDLCAIRRVRERVHPPLGSSGTHSTGMLSSCSVSVVVCQFLP